ncbi:MAG: hypothetical protein AAFN93_13075, partial [Bacteroidota bacterium]
QGDGSINQSQHAGTDNTVEELQPREIVILLERLIELLNDSGMSESQKKSAIRNTEAAKDVVLEENPDKVFGASALERVVKLIKGAEETIDAGNSFVSKVSPVLSKLLPWFGVALSL